MIKTTSTDPPYWASSRSWCVQVRALLMNWESYVDVSLQSGGIEQCSAMFFKTSPNHKNNFVDDDILRCVNFLVAAVLTSPDWTPDLAPA